MCTEGDSDRDKCIYLPIQARLMHPHVCTFDTIRIIEEYYHNHWISKRLYDEWMTVNLGDYRTTHHIDTIKLWDERLAAKKEDDYILRWTDELPIFDKENAVYYKRCNSWKGVLHARVSYKAGYNRNRYKLLNNWFPYASNADKAKTRLDLASIVFHAVKAGRICDVNHAFKHIPMGLCNSMAVMYIINALGNRDCSKMLKLINSDGSCAMGVHAQKTYLSAVTVAIRRSKSWVDHTPVDLQAIGLCSYWYMSLGRAGMRSNWPQEYTNRIETFLPLSLPGSKVRNEATNVDYSVWLSQALREIFTEMRLSSIKWGTWEHTIRTRQAWLSAGSSGGAKVVVDGKRYRVNKRTAIEQMEEADLLALIDTEPQLVATASEKFEPGKARAIYGTKIPDYLITSFVIMPLERHFNRCRGIESGVRGEDEVASIKRRYDNLMRGWSTEGIMLDYKDFNLQHTLLAQSKVYSILADMLREIGAESSLIKAADWVAAAKLNQKTTFMHLKGEFKVKQGMFSGQRDTDFTNTILNLAYYRVAERWIEENFKSLSVQHESLHKGDDMWVTSTSRIWGYLLTSALSSSGLLMQFSKQLLGPRIGEFLRVLYDETGACGYLGRAISTLLVAPMQSTDVLAPADRAKAVNKQIMTLVRRGLSVKCADILYDALIPHMLRSTIGETDCVSIPTKVAMIPTINNGLGINKIGKAPRTTVVIPPVPHINIENNTLLGHVNNNTSKDWVRYISAQVRGPLLSDKVMEAAHKANLSDSIPLDDQVKALRKHHRDLREWLVKYQAMNSGKLEMEALVLGDEAIDARTLVFYEGINAGMADRHHIKRHNSSKRNPVDVILRAINMSPFRDLDTAIQASGLDILAAAKYAIELCSDSYACADAKFALNDLVLCYGHDMTCALLKSIDGYNMGFEAYLHPIICSWLHKHAINMVLREQALLNRGCVQAFRVRLANASRCLLSLCVIKQDWAWLSRYQNSIKGAIKS